jgi:hypothetical protein
MNSKILALDKNLRPSCAQILETKDSWSLTPSNFPEDFLFNHLIIEIIKLKPFGKSFYYQFLKQKFKNYNWGEYKKEKITYESVISLI